MAHPGTSFSQLHKTNMMSTHNEIGHIIIWCVSRSYCTQNDRQLASECCLSVCSPVCLWRCVLRLNDTKVS